MNRSIIEKYKNQEDKLLLAKVLDKIKFCKTTNKIQSTDFLDTNKQNLIGKFLKAQKIANYKFIGGFKEAERKILIIYPEKKSNIIDSLDINELIKVIRIIVTNEHIGEYTHRNYLGGLIKLGIIREKIGDILVDEKGADILIHPDMEKYVLENITNLTRFNKAKIQKVNIESIKKIEINKEVISITVSSMRLDNIVSEIAKCSRKNANSIIEADRVLVNNEITRKTSKEIKINDTINIRGKGRFEIKQKVGNTKKGRIVIDIEKFC